MGRRLAILGLSLTAALLQALPAAAEPALVGSNDLGCSHPTRVLNGDSTESLNVGADETVLLESGLHTGALENLLAGSRLCIAPGATLSAPSIGSAAGRIVNAGTMIVPGFVAEPGFWLENSGSLLVTDGVTLGGGGRIENACRLRLRGTLDNSGDLSNDGSLAMSGALRNRGTVRQDQHGVVTGVDLVNDGAITGAGAYRFSGQTTNAGSAIGDSADRPITVDDTTPTGQAVFDVDSGHVTNVARAMVTPAPTDRPTGCTTPDPEPIADVAVTVTGPSSVAGGGQVTYEVTVTNLGPDVAAQVVAFAEFMPTDFTPAAVGHSGIASDGSASWRLGTLTAGETRRLTVGGFAPSVGELAFRASSWASAPDPVPENNDGSLSEASGTTVVAGPAREVPADPPREPASPMPVPQPSVWVTSPVNAPANRPPTVEDAELAAVAMTEVSGVIEATDPDPGQSVTFSLVKSAISGRADVRADGQFRYSPVGWFTGRDTFTVRGCDDGSPAQCDEGTISVAVLPAPRDDTVMTWAGKPVGVDVEGNDLGGASAPDWVIGPEHGSAVTGPTMVYTPGGSYTGWDTMTYQRCAPETPDLCARATLKVGVLPLAEDDFFTTPAGRAFLAAAAANDFGDAGDFTIIDEPDFGDVAGDSEGDFLYTPDEDFVGEDSFTYQVCSPNAPDLCDVGVVKMRVDDVIEPTAPVDSADPDDKDGGASYDAAAGRAGASSVVSPGPVFAAGLIAGGLIALALRWRRVARIAVSD